MLQSTSVSTAEELLCVGNRPDTLPATHLEALSDSAESIFAVFESNTLLLNPRRTGGHDYLSRDPFRHSPLDSSARSDNHPNSFRPLLFVKQKIALSTARLISQDDAGV